MFYDNIFKYIDKYGNISFEEKSFTDIDNIVFSLLSYLDLSDIDLKKYKTIEKIGQQYLSKHTLKEISKYGFSPKDAYKVLEKIINKKRYKDTILEDYNYNYNNMQFGALTCRISKKLIYISFEGTDQYIESWRESIGLISSLPILSHKEAIKYANKHIKLFGPNVIIGGHSKGGNLALIAGMNTKLYKKFKIKKIYSNDGPGLRKKDFNSLKYKLIKNKYIHFIPNNSIIGILLRNDVSYVVKSKTISFFSHSMSTWCIKDDQLVLSKLSKRHQHLQKRTLEWIDNHSDLERQKVIDVLFDVIKKCDIEDTMTLMKFKSIIKIIKELKNIDNESKKLAVDFLKYSFFNKKVK